jgi:two-component system response regulator RpaA
MPRLLLVDADPLAIAQVSTTLKLNGYDLVSAADGAAGLAMTRLGGIDAALIDLRLPKIDGCQLITLLRNRPVTRNLPVIVLSPLASLADKVRAFEAGADDYLVEPFEPEELLVRLKALLRRQSPPPAGPVEILRAGGISLFPEALQVHLDGHCTTVTPTEFEIVHCLLQHVDQPVPLATLLQEVWGYDADEGVEMLRVHIRHLRLKLERNPKAPRHLVTVPNVGYRLVVRY